MPFWRKHAGKEVSAVSGENIDTTMQPENGEQAGERKKRLIKLGAMLTLTVLILIFTTVAWFTMNQTVEADNMGVRAKGVPFEIAVKGSNVRNDEEFIKAASDYGYGDDDVLQGYYVTGASDSQIKIRFDPSENEKTVFGPDSSGEIEFYVVPTETGDLTVRIDLDVIGFKQAGDDIIRVSELTTDNSGLAQSAIDQCQTAENYLKGHILFFEEPGDTASTTHAERRYYYKKPITTGTLEKSFTNARKNEPQKVTIYWMWTNTLGQIALKDNNSGLRSDYPVVSDVVDDGSDISETDKGKLIQYLIDNKSMVFANHSSISDSEILDAKTEANFNKLSDGYNDADYQIGSNINYFMIDVTVTPAD